MASVTMIAAVAAGGAIGAILRYGVSLSFGAGLFGIVGPMATLLVNIASSDLMDCLAGAYVMASVLWSLLAFGAGFGRLSIVGYGNE